MNIDDVPNDLVESVDDVSGELVGPGLGRKTRQEEVGRHREKEVWKRTTMAEAIRVRKEARQGQTG